MRVFLWTRDERREVSLIKPYRWPDGYGITNVGWPGQMGAFHSANLISNFKPPQSRVLCQLADAKSVALGIRANAEGISKP